MEAVVDKYASGNLNLVWNGKARENPRAERGLSVENHFAEKDNGFVAMNTPK
jgi:hypothetical protein